MIISSEHPVSRLIAELASIGLSYTAIRREVWKIERVHISNGQISYHCKINKVKCTNYRNNEHGEAEKSIRKIVNKLYLTWWSKGA